MKKRIFIELDLELHNVKYFDCGQSEMNEFLIRHAHKNALLGLSKTWILPSTHMKSTQNKIDIDAYYTLTFNTIHRKDIPKDKHLPGYPIPVILLARLAVAVNEHEKGLGSKILVEALRKSLEISQQGLPAYGVIIDVLNEQALKFYKSFNTFTPFTNNPMRLFVSMNTIKNL